MRYDSRIDGTQVEIVECARKFGASVLPLFRLGQGAPDILVGYRSQNIMVEIKTENGKLNERQEKFRDEWKGQYAVVHNTHEMLSLLLSIP
jgi:hypothetical protein